MKRDMDLIRAILIVAEDQEEAIVESHVISLALRERFPEISMDDGKLVEHVQQMYESGFVETTIDATMGEGRFFTFLRLTSHGHDFLADARNEKVWEQAKSRAGNASIEVFTKVLAEVVKNVIGL